MKKNKSKKTNQQSKSILKKIGAHVFVSNLKYPEQFWIWENQEISEVFMKTLGAIFIILVTIAIFYITYSVLHSLILGF